MTADLDSFLDAHLRYRASLDRLVRNLSDDEMNNVYARFDHTELKHIDPAFWMVAVHVRSAIHKERKRRKAEEAA